MDLGLSTLTDDQLVELLIEVCEEAAQRDPIVRKATQNAIDWETKRLNTMREGSMRTIRNQREQLEDLQAAIQVAANQALYDYRQQLKHDVLEQVQEEIRTGTFRPMSPAEEAAAIVDAAKQANEAAMKGIDPEVYARSRSATLANLLRMGHTKEEIEKVYGKF